MALRSFWRCCVLKVWRIGDEGCLIGFLLAHRQSKWDGLRIMFLKEGVPSTAFGIRLMGPHTMTVHLLSTPPAFYLLASPTMRTGHKLGPSFLQVVASNLVWESVWGTGFNEIIADIIQGAEEMRPTFAPWIPNQYKQVIGPPSLLLISTMTVQLGDSIQNWKGKIWRVGGFLISYWNSNAWTNWLPGGKSVSWSALNLNPFTGCIWELGSCSLAASGS